MIIYASESDMSPTMEMLTGTAVRGLNILGSLFLFLMGALLVLGVVFFLIDITQSKDAVRRNYPVIGRFRGFFTELGDFFRQYFFAMDREEMPFNRAEREWIDSVTTEGTPTVPFGSTRVLSPGSRIFANGMFPKLESEYKSKVLPTIGKDTPNPYTPKRYFNISAMSYGSLSAPAVLALSNGARMAGCWLNTGEGGVSPYHINGNCDLVYQLGTAKFGARNDDGTLNETKLKTICDNPNVKMIELKLSQGAKPGKGGILPASKVGKEIADIRGVPEGQDAISPNRHVDAGNNEQLLDLIAQVRRVSSRPTGIKFVVGRIADVESLFEAIKARGIDSAPDFITLDGGNGGTGAAPMPLIDNVGLTLRDALPSVDDLLCKHGLRERIVLICAGKLTTPTEVTWAFCAGADYVNSARGFMFALGCIQALKCNKNTCPTGITTHDKRLQRGLDPENKAVRVMNYCINMEHEVDMMAHSCGLDHPSQLTREHVLIVGSNGRSKPFGEVWKNSKVK